MRVNYANEPVVKGEKAIFLAGPTFRNSEITKWRIEALEVLSKLNFDGVVYVPEYKEMMMSNDGEYLHQVEWERAALEAATTILFWVPRDLKKLPGFTTNVEFGYWIHSGKIIYGRPNNAVKVRYLDWLYEKECGLKPFDNLEDLIKEIIIYCSVM